MTLKGKSAIVTGSTSGIGLGIARALAAQGASVMLNGFGDAAAIEALRKELASGGGKIAYSAADLTKPEAVAGLVESCIKEFGTVDILVNNAGMQHVAPVDKFPLEMWDKVIQLNLSSCFQAIRAALPDMKKRNWGRIINIASAHGIVASVEKAAYVASKHGLIGLTKVVALETAKSGITCNAICPGWVLTPLVQKQIDALAERKGISGEAAKIDLLSEKQPSHEFATPEQIGGLAAFLCSPAADQIRGSSFSIDGGWTAQ
ncbi:MAG: 3-hydroxybutyrate dehydrogenase [Alphaproteobacteria bacterium]|nr:3-hydroxybutyrate dehydrogenase [Alphaproteobacteria bacterium]